MNNPQTSSIAKETAGNPDSTNANHPAVPLSHQLPPASPPHEKHHLLPWILVLLVVLLGVGVFFALHGKKAKIPTPPAVSITVTKVRAGDIAVSVPNLGSVTPVYTAQMSPRVDGQVISVNYTEGQMVASNDLLVVIDPGPYQAALLQAQGQLERDTNVLAEAQVDLKRYQAAYAKNAIAKQQLDDQVALVHQDEGTVKIDEGQVAAAQVNVNYCYIRAPFPGSVGLRLIDPGNVVHAANTNAIVVVAQLQPITVLFNVAEDFLPQIQQELTEDNQMTVEAWDRAEEHKIATGKVLALNNLIDAATGTIRIRAIFDNDKLTLFPNQFVNAKLIIKTLHDQCLIPTDAIQHNPEGAFVYLITNSPPATNHMAGARGDNAAASENEHSHANTEAAPGTTNAAGTNFAWVTMRDITVGTSDGDTTAVTKGLAPGEQIALDNFNKLGEGSKVIVHQQGGPGGESRPSRHRGGSYGKSSEGQPDDNKDTQ